ncbi:MAG: hypothetical protein ACI9AP_001079, partial [Flavobacteriales bacterium]
MRQPVSHVNLPINIGKIITSWLVDLGRCGIGLPHNLKENRQKK